MWVRARASYPIFPFLGFEPRNGAHCLPLRTCVSLKQGSSQNRPLGWFKVKKNIKLALKQWGSKLGIKQKEDWKSIKNEQIRLLPGGVNFLKLFPSAYAAACYIESPLFSYQQSYWGHTEHIKQFLDQLVEEKRLQTPSDWSHLTPEMIEDSGGASLLKKGSLYDHLRRVYPNEDWSGVRPAFDPSYWLSVDNQRGFLDFMINYYSLQYAQELLSLSRTRFCQIVGGKQILALYSDRRSLLATCFPEKVWPPSDYVKRWKDPAYHEEALVYCESVCQIKDLSDWRSIRAPTLRAIGANPLLSRYKTIYNMLKDLRGVSNCYQVQERLPVGVSNTISHRRALFKDLEKELNISSLEEWYDLSMFKMKQLGNYKVLGRPVSFIPEMLPYHCWDFYRFKHPHAFWRSDFGHHMEVMRSMQKVAGIRDPVHWTRVDIQKLHHHGKRCFQYYNSFLHLLLSVYPYRRNDILANSPSSFWKDRANVKTLVASLLNRFSITTKYQFCTVPEGWFSQEGFSSLLAYYGSWSNVAKLLFPSFRWDEDYFDQSNKRNPRAKLWACHLRHIFANIPIVISYHHYMEDMDETVLCFLPEYKIVIQYHSEQMYTPRNSNDEKYFQHLFEMDEAKRQVWYEKGYRIIILPYWISLDCMTLRSRLLSGRATEVEDLFKGNKKDPTLTPPLPSNEVSFSHSRKWTENIG